MSYNNGGYNLLNNSGFGDHIYHGNGGVSSINSGLLNQVGVNPVASSAAKNTASTSQMDVQERESQELLKRFKDNTKELGLKLTVDDKLMEFFIPPKDMKAISFDALSLRIGKWKKESVRDSDLVCKGNFNKRYFAWEVFDGKTPKNKIQFDFSSIGDITYNFSLDNGRKSSVTFKLKHSPSFFVELPLKQKKHTQWETHYDFTDNEASFLRSHVLELKPRVLEKYFQKIMMAHPAASYNLLYNAGDTQPPTQPIRAPTEDNNADNENEAMPQLDTFNMLRQIDDPPLIPPLIYVDEAFTSGVGCPPINGYVQEGAPSEDYMDSQDATCEDGADYMDYLDDQTIIDAISQFNLPDVPSLIDNPQQPPSSFVENCYGVNQNDAMCNHYVPDVARVIDDPRQLPSSSVDEASSSGVGRPQGSGYLLEHVENAGDYNSSSGYHFFVNWENNQP